MLNPRILQKWIIELALKAASKELTFEVGSDNAYTVLESLFGVPRDKTLETDVKTYKNSPDNHKNISNHLRMYSIRLKEMATV